MKMSRSDTVDESVSAGALCGDSRGSEVAVPQSLTRPQWEKEDAHISASEAQVSTLPLVSSLVSISCRCP